MSDVATVKMHARFLADRGRIANGAEIVLINVWPLVKRHLLNALRLQARHALGLASYSSAWMAAREHLVAGLLHEGEAIAFSANVAEGWLHAGRRLLQFVAAESAGGSILLIASLSSMVWLRLTFDAKVLSTSIAPDSILSHMLCSLSTQRISFIIFLALDDLSFLHHHHIST